MVWDIIWKALQTVPNILGDQTEVSVKENCSSSSRRNTRNRGLMKWVYSLTPTDECWLLYRSTHLLPVDNIWKAMDLFSILPSFLISDINRMCTQEINMKNQKYLYNLPSTYLLSHIVPRLLYQALWPWMKTASYFGFNCYNLLLSAFSWWL